MRRVFGGIGGVGVLEALALTDGVVGEDGEAVAGEGAGEGVVGDFAGEAVAGRDDDGGEFFLGCAGFRVGEIEECGDGEVGLGVVEDFFDAEAVGLRGAEDFCVERSFFGEAADEGEDLFADLSLAGFGLGAGGDRGDGGAARGGFFGGDVVEVVGELGAADVGGAVGVGFLRGVMRSARREGLRREEWRRTEMEGSHRPALIHRWIEGGQ